MLLTSATVLDVKSFELINFAKSIPHSQICNPPTKQKNKLIKSKYFIIKSNADTVTTRDQGAQYIWGNREKSNINKFYKYNRERKFKNIFTYS